MKTNLSKAIELDALNNYLVAIINISGLYHEIKPIEGK